ncbi:MAG: Gfo/Idh/MocA family protein [Planctomycetota bacterium]|jgi:predicted dehydrogenase
MRTNKRNEITRRDLLATGAVAATTISGFPLVRTSHAQNVRPLKVGLIGCGGRGTSSLREALKAAPNIRITALADPFKDRIEQTLRSLKDSKRMKGLIQGVDVKPDHCFTGLDGFKRLLQTDIDWVNLVGPPGFRPRHFAAAVEAGKHVFLEKPVATDPAGVRKILKTAKRAKEKGLSVVVGFDNRHNPARIEAVKRIHNGAIGQITSGTSYNYTRWTRWFRGDDPSWSEMEFQCRNWYYFCWLSGDVIVEQSIHTIDVTNWVMGAYPIRALGQGGRQLPLDSRKGNIWDHMTVDYEYPNGAHVIHMDRQWPNCHGSGTAGFIGTKGKYAGNEITGQHPWRFDGQLERSGVYEQRAMIESIRKSKPRSEAENGAYAALTAIIGRESAYTGKLVTWDEILNSDLDLLPKKLEFGPAPKRAVPVPGRPRPL